MHDRKKKTKITGESVIYSETTWWLSYEGLKEQPGGSTSTAGMRVGFDTY